MQRGRARFWDAVLYLGISSALIAGFLVVMSWGISEAELMRWTALVLSLVFCLGLQVEAHRNLWGKKRYWIFMGSMLILHCAGFALLEVRKAQVTGRGLGLIICVEFSVIQGLLALLFRKKGVTASSPLSAADLFKK